MLSRHSYHRLELLYQEFQILGKDISSTSIGHYFVYDLIGQGAFGKVYRGMDDRTKYTVALKVIDLKVIQTEENHRKRDIMLRLSETEDKMMILCDSPNLIRCFDVYENQDLKIIVMEYCNEGTLDEFIEKHKKIPEKEAIMILKHILNGIAVILRLFKELHTHRIIHRDLKAQNILKHNEKFKIADFGFSKKLDIHNDEVIGFHTLLGTECTMAPEVINKQKYGLKADIWSVGIIFYKMLFGQLPFASARRHELKNSEMLKKAFKTKKVDLAQHTEDFLRAVLVVDQAERIGWRDVLKHPVFSLIDNQLSEILVGHVDVKEPINADFSPEQLFDQQIMRKMMETGKLIKIGQKEMDLKRKELLASQQDKLYDYLSNSLYQCLKIKLVHFEIILELSKPQNLDISIRQSIELIYLLSTRCFLDISPINNHIKHHRTKQSSLAQIIKQIQQLYDIVYANWQHYSSMLTHKENSLLCMISDFFEHNQARKQKDSKMNGIQRQDYSKREQVQFIQENYIRPMLSSKKLKPHLKASGLIQRYKDIILSEPQKFVHRRFDDCIEDLLGQ